jgi:hypothetical protein
LKGFFLFENIYIKFSEKEEYRTNKRLCLFDAVLLICVHVYPCLVSSSLPVLFHVVSSLIAVCAVVLAVNSQRKSIKYKTDKYANKILLILFVNSMLKQQSTQLPAMKAVISTKRLSRQIV